MCGDTSWQEKLKATIFCRYLSAKQQIFLTNNFLFYKDCGKKTLPRGGNKRRD
jgi:hypothetical protein